MEYLVSLPCTVPMFLVTFLLHISDTTQGIKNIKISDRIVQVFDLTTP